MTRALAVAVALTAGGAWARDGETGTFGLGDPFELGAIAGPWSVQSTTPHDSDPPSPAATLVGVRLHAGAYTHRTILGNGGGVELDTVIGYAVASKGFFWGQLDGLANVGLFNHGFGPVVVRLHLLVGFGFSLYSGTSLEGGARLALGVAGWAALEASYVVLPTVNLTFAHRAQASLAISPIQVALGAELNFGEAIAGQQHFSIIGTLAWRPKFD